MLLFWYGLQFCDIGGVLPLFCQWFFTSTERSELDRMATAVFPATQSSMTYSYAALGG